MAHGAELVSYFRWRQAPFGQEQMHAGLLRPDHADAPAAAEVRAVADEVAALPVTATARAPVALLFSYEAQWLLGIQPQGRGLDPLRQAFDWYAALRALGLDVDIVAPGADLTGYRLIVAPSLPIVDAALRDRLLASGAVVLLGPRSASKTADFQIPDGLPLAIFGDALPIRVTRVESLPPGHAEPVAGGGAIERWLEDVEGDAEARLRLDSGAGVLWAHGRLRYLAGQPTTDLLARIVRDVAADAGLATMDLPDGLRLRRRGELCFAFNYAPEPVRLSDHVATGALLLGEDTLPPAGVAVWRAAPFGQQ